MISLKFTNTLVEGMKKYFQKIGIFPNKSIGADKKAKTDVAVHLLSYILKGSPKTSKVPPILKGILRGSGSVFVGGKMIQSSRVNYPSGTPNTSYTADKDTITIGFNTSYAGRLHEMPFSEEPKKGHWSPGIVSRDSGDVGNKFIEEHLKLDGKILMSLYAKILKKLSGG